MANIKSAKKRIEVIDKKTLRNKMIKSKVKTVIKKVEAAIAAGDKEAAQANLLVAISEINKPEKYAPVCAHPFLISDSHRRSRRLPGK